MLVATRRPEYSVYVGGLLVCRVSVTAGNETFVVTRNGVYVGAINKRPFPYREGRPTRFSFTAVGLDGTVIETKYCIVDAVQVLGGAS